MRGCSTDFISKEDLMRFQEALKEAQSHLEEFFKKYAPEKEEKDNAK